MTNAKFFRDIVTDILISKNKEIKVEDLYLNQTLMYYSLSYMPKYPEKTAADFVVYRNVFDGTMSLYSNLDAMIPTIRHFENMSDFNLRL
jgi:hypothetical protein